MSLASLVWPLAGGLLIGMAAAVFLLWEGRVAGVSGLVAEASGSGRAVACVDASAGQARLYGASPASISAGRT